MPQHLGHHRQSSHDKGPCLPPSSPSLIVTLQHAHGTGHEGTEKTLNLFRADFHVPGHRMVV
jgi:hypothetical protein